MLYPLKFKPLLKERIWGGEMLARLKKNAKAAGKKIGESWELSGVPGDVSVVSNGLLKGNSLAELLEVYMGDLAGEKVFEQFGEMFPLLVKLIDARDVLSIQVHPDDKLALERHNSYGKTEMWYVVEADQDAALYVGFREQTSQEQYLAAVETGTLPSLLNRIPVKAGDAYFIPAGVIHAIGKGLVIAEIQQTSDITYRVDDWGRTDDKGNPRQLHTELAVGAIDFGNPADYDITVAPQPNRAVEMKKCPYFTTNLVQVDGVFERDYAAFDSFVILVCLEGELTIDSEAEPQTLVAGETALIPASLECVILDGKAKLLEVYV